MQRSLIIKLLTERLMINQCWYCTFWNYGLEKTPGSLLLAFLFSLLASVWTPRTCDLPQENAVFENRLRMQPLMNKTSSKHINNCFGFLLKKHLLASVGKVPIPLCLCHRAGCYCEAISEQWTQKHFQACQRREDSLDLANKTTLTSSFRNTGSRGQSTKGRAHT